MMIRVAAGLFGQLYRNLCVECLAEEIGSSFDDAEDVTRTLTEGGASFIREWHACARCHDFSMVLSHVPTWPLYAYASE